MPDNLIVSKTEDFAVRIVNLWKYLLKKKEYNMSVQLKRAGTSVGANVTEAIYASSAKDFLNKMYIAYKELNESKYWLRLLHRTDFLSDDEFHSIYADAIEIDKILTSIIKTKKKNLNKNQ